MIKDMQLPRWLDNLCKRIFEELPAEEAREFIKKLNEAIPTDKDLVRVRHDLAILRLTDSIRDSNGLRANDAIRWVIKYHENPSEELRVVVLSQAWSAVGSASRSGQASAAWSVTESPWSSIHSVECASYLLKDEAWQNERDNLLKLLTA